MSEIFDYCCPAYLTYGMTWEQYWYGDPWMAKAYADSYMMKRRIHNEELWLGGLYVYRAVYAVIASAFGGRNEKYVSQPFDFLPKTKAERDLEEYEKKQKVIRYFDSLLARQRTEKAKGTDEHGEP